MPKKLTEDQKKILERVKCDTCIWYRRNDTNEIPAMVDPDSSVGTCWINPPELVMLPNGRGGFQMNSMRSIVKGEECCSYWQDEEVATRMIPDHIEEAHIEERLIEIPKPAGPPIKLT